MPTIRTYTATDVIELIDVLRSSEDISPCELAGMELLGRLLRHLENMTDGEIAEEAWRYFRCV